MLTESIRFLVCDKREENMINSKSWKWEIVDENTAQYWKNPAIESYYLVNRWKQQGKKKFLDLGCGLGRHSILFAKNGFTTWAFDLSTYAVTRTKEWAQTEKLEISCMIGDMLTLPYGNNQFDCILCRNVISHSDTEGVKKILGEIFRVMRPGGECYVTLGSKNAWGFHQPWPVVDENTKIRVEDGPENGIPHFYADITLIEKLCKDFEILLVQHSNEFIKDDTLHSVGWHWHILLCKR